MAGASGRKYVTGAEFFGAFLTGANWRAPVYGRTRTSRRGADSQIQRIRRPGTAPGVAALVADHHRGRLESLSDLRELRWYAQPAEGRFDSSGLWLRARVSGLSGQV